MRIGNTLFPALDQSTSKDCNKNELSDLADKLSSLEGEIPTNYLKEDLGNTETIFNINKVVIIDIQNATLVKGQDYSFANTSITSANKIVGSFKLIRIDCNNCDSAGKKTFKVVIKDSEKEKDLWINTVFLKKIEYLKSKENLNDIDISLSESNFTKTEGYFSDPQNYFSDFEKIKFFRPATKILKDMALKNDLLVKNYLVKQGSSVQVVLKNDSLSISNRGQAMGNGKYGEAIKIKTNNKKELTGIVKDFNRVEVQL